MPRARALGVTLLERRTEWGKKILATGNGRCNVTNVNCSIENFHGADMYFIRMILNQFPVTKTLEFFNALGYAPGGRRGSCLSLTGQASTVLDVLRA